MKKYIRVYFIAFENGILLTETSGGEKVHVKCNEEQCRELFVLRTYLHPGNVFHLVYWRKNGDSYETEHIIYEPDYLLDISALAECFRPFGSHPLNYTLGRFRLNDNTRHILLGNIANYFIDELINEKAGENVCYEDAIRKSFLLAPFEYTACEELKDSSIEREFFVSCRNQFDNIQKIIRHDFPAHGMDINKVILEPSFICSTLGLQGRMDILWQDYSALIELKSGKAGEDFRTHNYLHSANNHYIQMILYLAVLQINMDLENKEIRSFLLYSKYPVLTRENLSVKTLKQVLNIRNAMVALDFSIQKKNCIRYTREILSHIRGEVLNRNSLTGNFYENYLRPQIEFLPRLIKELSSAEETYFFRMYTFIVKELWLSKAGRRDYEGNSLACNLWNTVFDEKLAAGEVLYDLNILDNQADSEKHTLLFSVPDYGECYLPNFRAGDAVVLYPGIPGTDSVNTRQVFKGTIESFGKNKLVVRLRARQRNHTCLPMDSTYIIEHDYMDSTYTAMFRALSLFAQADPERRRLIMGLRKPGLINPTNDESEDDPIARIRNKALNAEDCCLIIGPPGTGKTSHALKEIVRACLEQPEGNLLLLAYTNRAVDEICHTLAAIHPAPAFVRLGSELNCDPVFRENLLDRRLSVCANRREVSDLLNKSRVFVGTVASVSLKSNLFSLKHFDMAIIDEASQLLEPHLLGILSAKHRDGRNAVRRFVLIGDHKQLPAIVLQSEEESMIKETELQDCGFKNLRFSFFERLYTTYSSMGYEHAYDRLDRQGRMHPVIAGFPSCFFYEGKLVPVGLPHQRVPFEESLYKISAETSKKQRLMFIPSQTGAVSESLKTNPSEAIIISDIIHALYLQAEEKGDPLPSIGVIAPYRNQIALIRKKLSGKNNEILNKIIIDTVERFQGSQRDIILFSFCVNHPSQLSQLSNLMEENGFQIDRKLNVVMTRAKKQLILVGNPSLLAQNNLYNCLINYIRKNGIISNVYANK